jgi:regulatory protein
MSLDLDPQLQRALDLAYAFINRRDRTVAEVRAQLERKGVSEDLREAAIQTLCGQSLIDDDRFARLFVTDKRELEQWGSERIRRGLLTRGIDRELAETALQETSGRDLWPGTTADTGASGASGGTGAPEESELDRALALLRRRFPDPPGDRRERERALGVLLRKGYESELALDALATHARGG